MRRSGRIRGFVTRTIACAIWLRKSARASCSSSRSMHTHQHQRQQRLDDEDKRVHVAACGFVALPNWAASSRLRCGRCLDRARHGLATPAPPRALACAASVVPPVEVTSARSRTTSPSLSRTMRPGAVERADRELLRRILLEPQSDRGLGHHFRQQEEIGRAGAGERGDDIQRVFRA